MRKIRLGIIFGGRSGDQSGVAQRAAEGQESAPGEGFLEVLLHGDPVDVALGPVQFLDLAEAHLDGFPRQGVQDAEGQRLVQVQFIVEK